ncbi:hypothetical protein [Haliangium sp.]|uniref:hypothetical protein n=1 Tax=Haliangium sp. TaxID=2663208 RepID=UPI003D10467B
MLELVEFPYLPGGDPKKAVSSLMAVCRELPAQGEQFRFFRRRMKEHKLWDDALVLGTLQFLGIEKAGTMRPSPFSRKLGGIRSDDKARALLADRLWEVNPILFKAIVEYLNERVYSRDEVIKYIDSFAYRGTKPTRPQLEAWLHLALGLQILKMVGIALDLDDRGREFLERAAEFDVEEFLEDRSADSDPSEPGGEADEADDEAAEADLGDDADADADQPPASPARAAAPAQSSRAPAPELAGLSSPRGRERPVTVSRFAGEAVFPDDVLAETTARIEAWWGEQTSEAKGLRAGDFGFEAEAWMEGAEEVLYQVAVAAALVFRLQRDVDGVRAAFEALSEGGVLRDLYYGTAPEALPQALDAQALMLASLLARRFAEVPELAATLEKQASAGEAFAVLEQALGRGLLRIELFWMMGALSELGALRLPDLDDYTALPRRPVRDTLYRLGFVTTPYAHDAASLVPAARATRRAAGAAGPPDQVLMGFAVAAGCAYDCPHRRQCEYACRERAE